MRILVESGDYKLRNHGDTVMLMVAIERLRELWPGARIEVITDAPNLLATCCPGAHPIPVHGRTVLRIQNLFDSIHTRMPWRVLRRSSKTEKAIRCCRSLLRHSWMQGILGSCRISGADVITFLTALAEADLVVASGGGYVTDLFEAHAALVLSLLGIAIRLGRTTAMLGQGLGPIRSPGLLARAKHILPLVDLVAVRERRVGPAILNSIGVAPERVAITGDDAIELAYEGRSAVLGTGIGVNLRVASYSEVDVSDLEVVRAVLRNAAEKYSVPLIPLPILLDDTSGFQESDAKIIGQVVAGHEISDEDQNVNTPIRLLEQVRRCRIVVTGSYHAGVFALAQGIPVVGLAKSAYYVDKLLGLADQFGAGCKFVFLGDEQVREKLIIEIDNAWKSAERVRPHLLEAARVQIKLSRAAYRRIYELVASRRAPVCLPDSL